MLYWLWKEKIALIKAQSLFDLIQSIPVSAIEAFHTHLPATIRNMVFLITQIIKEKQVDKMKTSQGFTCQIDK